MADVFAAIDCVRRQQAIKVSTFSQMLSLCSGEKNRHRYTHHAGKQAGQIRKNPGHGIVTTQTGPADTQPCQLIGQGSGRLHHLGIAKR